MDLIWQELIMNKEDIYGFRGKNFYLSNMYEVDLLIEDIIYKSAENAYVAYKTDNIELRKKIATMPPRFAKVFGKSLKKDDWNDLQENNKTLKENIMMDILKVKFNNPELRKKLKSTGDCYIEETNTWQDTFWGVYNNIGQNKLGKIIMEIRNNL